MVGVARVTVAAGVAALLALASALPAFSADLGTESSRAKAPVVPRVIAPKVEFMAGAARVSWQVTGPTAGMTTRVSVQVPGFAPVETVITRPLKARNSTSVSASRLLETAATQIPGAPLSAVVSIVDASGKVVASAKAARKLAQLPPPRDVAATPKNLAYEVSWNAAGYTAYKELAVVFERNIGTNETAIHEGSAFLGKLEVDADNLSARLVQVVILGSNAMSSPAPSSALAVTPINPVGADVTPPAPPCCLNWSPGPGELTVMWNATDHPGAAGFLIRYGTSSTATAVVRVPFGGVTNSYILTGLEPRTRYLVTVSSWDSAGNLSNPSNPVEYMTG